MNKYIAFIKNWRGNLNISAWLLTQTKPFYLSLLVLLATSTTVSLTSVGLAIMHKRVVDAATSGGDVAKSMAFYAGVTFTALLIGVLSSILSTVISERFSFSIRRGVYNSVLHTCLSDQNRYHSGDVVTRLTSDVGIVASGISEIIPSLLSLAVTFLTAFFTLLYYDRGLAVFALIMGPVAAVVSLITGRQVKRIQIKLQESESAYRSNLQENLENIIVLKAFEGQDAALTNFDTLRANYLYWVMRRQKIGALARLALNGSFQIVFVAVFAYSAYQLSAGTITFGTMTMFFALVSQIQAPLMNLAQMLPRVVSIFASAERLHEMQVLPQEDMTIPDLARGAMRVEIRNLCFAYGNDSILQDANATISAGEFVALMGSSGIGKTTLVRLIMSFYIPHSGSLDLVDSSGMRASITAGTRHFMSYVPQGNTLMSGTISHNLRAGNPAATEEVMWKILTVVAAADFIRDTPNGLNTVIGERGLGLSEGQAQRIAIARALIRNAPLLILDEATSALDEETELAVLEHLRVTMPRPTCILITHRRSVLRFCDRCLRIQNKQLEEMPFEPTSSALQGI